MPVTPSQRQIAYASGELSTPSAASPRLTPSAPPVSEGAVTLSRSEVPHGEQLLELSPAAPPADLQAAAQTQGPQRSALSRFENLAKDPLGLVGELLHSTDVVHTAQTSRHLNARLRPGMPHQQARARVERIVQAYERDVATLTARTRRALEHERREHVRDELLATAWLELGRPEKALSFDVPDEAMWTRVGANVAAGHGVVAQGIIGDALEFLRNRGPHQVARARLEMARAKLSCGDHEGASQLLRERDDAFSWVDRFEHARLTAMVAFSGGASANQSRDVYEDEMNEAILDECGPGQEWRKDDAPVEKPIWMAEFCAFIGDADAALEYLDVAADRGSSHIGYVLNSRLAADAAENAYWRDARARAARITDGVNFMTEGQQQVAQIAAGLTRAIANITAPLPTDWMSMATIAYQLGRPERARDIIETAYAQGRTVPTFATEMLLARADIQAGDFSSGYTVASEALDSLAQDELQLEEATMILAEALILAEDEEGAAETLRQTSSAVSEHSEHELLMAMSGEAADPERVLIHELERAMHVVGGHDAAPPSSSEAAAIPRDRGLRMLELLGSQGDVNTQLTLLARWAQRPGSIEVARLLRSPHSREFAENEHWQAAQAEAERLVDGIAFLSAPKEQPVSAAQALVPE